MSERDPIKMAVQIAAVRASETFLPEEERVFADPYAEHFLTDEIRESLRDVSRVRAGIAQYEQMMPGVNGAIVARIRFIDEYMQECAEAGFQQLVIIGAGFDTRAYRLEPVKSGLKVFEVDHPATQQVKIDAITRIFDKPPSHVSYVPLVFGADRLDQKLLENDYDPKLKTLFVAEGLLMYIPPAAVDGLLSFIVHASGPGSAFVADFFESAVIEGTSPLKEAQVLRQFVEQEGAPLQFGIPTPDAGEFFKNRGFSSVKTVTAADCKETYFKNASLNRSVSPIFNFVCATV